MPFSQTLMKKLPLVCGVNSVTQDAIKRLERNVTVVQYSWDTIQKTVWSRTREVCFFQWTISINATYAEQ